MKLSYLLGVLLCGMAALVACSGSNGRSAATSEFINRARFQLLSTGYKTFFNFSGSDSNGVKYFGNLSTTVGSVVTLSNSSSVIPKTSTMSITRVGANPVLSPYFYGYSGLTVTYSLTYSSTYYYHSDKTLYKVVYSPSGLTATPANSFTYPSNMTTFLNPTSASGLALTYSNGISWTSAWGVTPNIDSYNDSQFQVSWYNYSTLPATRTLSETDTYIIDPTGAILRYSSLLQNFPTPGVTTTLTSY